MKPVSWLLPVLLAAIPVSTGAQEREGFASSYGPAVISGSINCDGCNAESFTGAGGFLRVGQYLRSDLLVAVEASLHMLPLAYTRQDTSFLLAAVQWYPRPGSDIYVKGNLGVAKLVETDDEDDSSRRKTLTAPALGISVGYDIGTSRSFLLTPFLSITHAFNADYKVNGQRAGTANATAFQLGLGITFY
jgi:hypothetical protein